MELIKQNIFCIQMHDISQSLYSPIDFPVEKFRELVEYVNSIGYKLCSFRNYLNSYEKEKLIVLTFDDSYQGILNYALPILSEFEFTATVFIPTDYIGLDNTWNKKDKIKRKHLTLKELHILSDNGWEMASHGTSHDSLLKLSKQDIVDSLINSKTFLESIFGVVNTYAYPYGHFNSFVKELVSKTYSYAFSDSAGGSNLRMDQYQIRRYNPDELFEYITPKIKSIKSNKILGLFRGFPGLGRIVAGIELIKTLEKDLKKEIKIITYSQGIGYCKSKNIFYLDLIEQKDCSSIGIIPVSPSGERIMKEIEEFRPEIIVIDGEPLMTFAIKLRFPEIRLIGLLNPLDIDNPNNILSSQIFFQECYSYLDYSIIHGLIPVNPSSKFKNYISIPTILRSDVVNFSNEKSLFKISCIMGGGTVESNMLFLNDTIEIAKKCLLLAKNFSEITFEIYCASQNIYTIIKGDNLLSNVVLHHSLKEPKEIYDGAIAVIARGGRNTISEILSLGKPAILFSTNSPYRGHEQKVNIHLATSQSKVNIVQCDLQISELELVSILKKILNSKNYSNPEFKSGLSKACDYLIESVFQGKESVVIHQNI